MSGVEGAGRDVLVLSAVEGSSGDVLVVLVADVGGVGCHVELLVMVCRRFRSESVLQVSAFGVHGRKGVLDVSCSSFLACPSLWPAGPAGGSPATAVAEIQTNSNANYSSCLEAPT